MTTQNITARVLYHPIGTRVLLHPYTAAFRQGDKTGHVIAHTRGRYRIKLEISGKVKGYAPEFIIDAID